MKGFVVDIEKQTEENDNFRQVLYTDSNVQLVVMSLKPGEDIGEEVHAVDQFIRTEIGEGKSILNNDEHDLKDGVALVIPKGTLHNIINASGTKSMKLYTVYAPPNHRDGTLHKTKRDALSDETDHYNGKTSE